MPADDSSDEPSSFNDPVDPEADAELTSDTNSERPTFNLQPSTLRDALLLLDRLDSSSPPRPPTVLAVFRLYCVQQMTIAEVARACRCSVGTICNRLKLLRAKTGLNLEKLGCSDGTARPTRGRPKRPQPET